MTGRIMTGNEAVARGALRAGVKVATGYPGTPSTGCIAHLLTLDLPKRHVEWSTNEKVAFEIASGAAWAGHRALCTMKMSGVNVAYDALISIAYSGTNGGLVIYVADDPGVSAGMPEQDSRGFALMSYLPMLEPATPAEAYELVQRAFDVSEVTGAPVFLRTTTAIALGHAEVDAESPRAPAEIEPILEKDITRYTKAGSKICKDQHQASIDRLVRSGEYVQSMGLNRLTLASSEGGTGIVCVGAVNAYLPEALERVSMDAISLLEVRTTVPFPWDETQRLLEHCEQILVLEELEAHAERAVSVAAQQSGFSGAIIGKMNGPLSPIGEVGVTEILAGLNAAGLVLPQGSSESVSQSNAEGVAILPAKRPITVCAGCPHRGTYLAVDAAIQRAGFTKDDVMVTGDIGCTILGMNPPFDLLWNEVSMGSSISLAQGYVHAGVRTPVIATMGDSTFFHGGIPGLVNAIQHQVPMTLVVMDNGWTCMTGMQVNPGTHDGFQGGGRRVDLEAVIRGLGPDHMHVVDPFDLEATTDAVHLGLQSDGVTVVLAQRECAIQSSRRKVRVGTTTIDAEACILCKRCLNVTGCPALQIRESESGSPSMHIDFSQCTGCGLCASFCPTGAITHTVASKESS